MPLSDLAVRTAKPRDKAYKLFDGGGLFLLIQPPGGKWWRYEYRFGGKRKLLAIGTYPDTSLADARKRHLEARQMLAAGNDPSEVKKESKRLALLGSDNTFEAMAHEWHKARLNGWSENYAGKLMTSLQQDIFPKLGNRPIDQITSLELLTVLRLIESRGALETAHRAKQTCGQIFMYAIASGRAERNPAADLKMALKVPERKHYSHLKADELPEFLQKLESYADEGGELLTQLALKMLVLTFVRTTELRGALWSEINWEKAEWRIPASRMKMKDPHIVPLSDQVMSLLKELQTLTGQWKYLFPNENKPGFDCMSENTMLFALYRMGYRSRTTGHGFRATASTILNENGFPSDHIERQLAHCERNKIRAAYNHAQYLPERRQMVQWWADYIDAAKGGKVIVGKFGT